MRLRIISFIVGIIWLFIGLSLFIKNLARYLRWNYIVAWMLMFGIPCIILLKLSFRRTETVKKISTWETSRSTATAREDAEDGVRGIYIEDTNRLYEDEKKVIEYFQHNPTVERERNQIYEFIGRETGLSIDKSEEIIRSLRINGIIRLSSGTSFSPPTKSSVEFIKLELSPHWKDRLDQHIGDKHAGKRKEKKKQKGLRKLSAPRLVQCPYCNNKVRMDRLDRHIRRVHKGRVISNRVALDELARELLSFLVKRNFEAERLERYIVARHRVRHEVFVIKIEDSRECVGYSKLATMVIPRAKFEWLIRMLDKASRFVLDKDSGVSMINSSKLQTDVITAFGWHADVSEKTRHIALELASEVWGEEHISNLLKFLRNTWKNNPLLEHHASTVEADYRWFESERSSMFHNTLKTQMIQKLQDELVSLGIASQFQKFFTSFEDVHRWFIITY